METICVNCGETLTNAAGERVQPAYYDMLLPSPKSPKDITWARCEECYTVGRRRNDERFERVDAKVIAAISDLNRREITELLAATGRVFRHTERTAKLREYIRKEYAERRITSEDILATYQGGL